MSPTVRRRDAVRMLVSRRQVSGSLKLARPPQLGNSVLAGAQAALTVAIAVSAVALSPWSSMIGAASIGALAALFGRFAPKARRTMIVVYASLCLSSAIMITSLAAWAGLHMTGMLILLSVLGGVYFLISSIGRFGPPGALIFMFAGMAGMHAPASLGDVGIRVAVAVFGGLVALIVCGITEKLRRAEPDASLIPQPVQHQLAELWPAFVRLSVGASVAGLIAYAMGVSHPGWAAMGATATLQGVHLHLTMHRAIQRVAGNVVGAVLIWILLAQEPSIWVGLIFLVGLQLVTEIVIGFNYALGQIFVTPMALLMTYLATPGVSGATMAPERIVDTLLGAVIGVIIAIVLSTRKDRNHLRTKHEADGSGI